MHTQATLDALIRAQELKVCVPDSLRSRLIAYLELQFRASKLPRAGSCACHFLVGSRPGGGSSRTPPAPQGVPPLPGLKCEVSVPDALQRGRLGRMNRRAGARRRLSEGPGPLPPAEGFLSGWWGGGQPSLRPSEVPCRARQPDTLPGLARGPADLRSAQWGALHASKSSCRVQYFHSLAFRNSKFWEPKKPVSPTEPSSMLPARMVNTLLLL